MASVPTGGRKKKLKARAAASDTVIATHRRDDAATNNSSRRYDSATVVTSVTCSHAKYAHVTAATPPIARNTLRNSARLASVMRGVTSTVRLASVSRTGGDMALSTGRC